MSARNLFNDYESFDESVDFGLNEYSHTYTQSINYLGKEIISINEDKYEYTGGAHGNYWSNGLNFAINPTHEIHLENLIDYEDFESFLEFLSIYCQNELKAKYDDVLRENFEQGDEVFF